MNKYWFKNRINGNSHIGDEVDTSYVFVIFFLTLRAPVLQVLFLKIFLEGFVGPLFVDQVLLPAEELEDWVTFRLDQILHL